MKKKSTIPISILTKCFIRKESANNQYVAVTAVDCSSYLKNYDVLRMISKQRSTAELRFHLCSSTTAAAEIIVYRAAVAQR